MLQLFCYKQSKFTRMELLCQESTVAQPYKDISIEHSVPHETGTDNAKVLISTKFKNLACKDSISTSNTVPYYQNQNFGKGEDDNFKFFVFK